MSDKMEFELGVWYTNIITNCIVRLYGYEKYDYGYMTTDSDWVEDWQDEPLYEVFSTNHFYPDDMDYSPWSKKYYKRTTSTELTKRILDVKEKTSTMLDSLLFEELNTSR